MKIQHMMAVGIDSPIRDRCLAVGRTAADDLAEYSGGGSTMEDDDDSDVQTMSKDLERADFTEGYHDEKPADFLDDEELEEPHDWKKRHSDTRLALDRERAEKAALQAQLASIQQQRSQPQPIQQQGIDPMAAIDQAYAQEKERLKVSTMNAIKGFNRQDPQIQDKIADAWARHSEQVVELASATQEKRSRYAADNERALQSYRDREAGRALAQAGFDPVSDKDAFIDKVILLNGRTPGWERGMSDAQTYEYVAEQMRQGGYVSSNSQQQLTPRQQHEALRNNARSAVRPGARQDPAAPKKKALPEEKDVSFFDQMRQLKRSRQVTIEQARRMKVR